jgi:SAM-dependent methyltransferase
MNVLRYSLVRVVQSCRRDGLRTVFFLVGKNLPRSIYDWVIRYRMREHALFDAKYGVDTQMPVRVSDLEMSAPGAQFANRYEGTPIAAINKIIRRLKVNSRRFTFIDLGSGKGRVLLVAAQYPFKSVIGIEFSKKLHDIALLNIERFRDSGLHKTTAWSINCDAGQFDFAEIGDKIIFCYNPFGAVLMDRVLDNLQSLACQKGETIFVYLGPMPQLVAERLNPFPVIDKGEFLSEFGFFERYSIYKMH